MRSKNIFAARTFMFGLALLFPVAQPTPTMAQEVADTIRVNTRVVFMDALVKDKRTGVPISDLKPENFEVFDDGKLRPISYFTREGEARKPLALVLILDLRDDGAGRFLRRPEVLETIAGELTKLSPEDEVAIMAVNFDEDRSRKMLTDFTRDRNQIAAALKQVPALMVSEDERIRAMINASGKDTPASDDTSDRIRGDRTEADMGAVRSQLELNKPAENPASNQNILAVETYKDPRTGVTIIRTIMKDGTVAARRESKTGKVNVATGEEYSLYAAAREISAIATVHRPNSRAAIVWVTDGIIPIIVEDRNATADLLIRSNVTFNSLTVSMRTLYKFLLPFAKPVGNWIGMSFSGSAKYLAKQSGGEAVQVSRTGDYARGLSKIIGNLTARYSLGFTLTEEERDDGRLHNLEIRVKAPDAKGKQRKLEVNSRRGYSMTTATEKEATASRAQ
ncbi:MAG: VWA domain-containing protein [Pyrinomonadaceae bacterium]|nr:VWA domain-containing protein [Pyrinomonadaceae bacterium]